MTNPGDLKGILLSLTLLSGNLAASPLMYVPTGGDDRIVIIDLETDRITGHIEELENPHGLSSSAGTEYLVAGSMEVRQAGDAAPTRPEAVTEAEHRAHHEETPGASGPAAPSYVSVVHPRHGRVMRRIEVPALTHHTGVSPDGRWAVAVHSGAGGVTVIDLLNDRAVKTVPTGARPNYAVFNQAGDRLYVSNAGAGTISELTVPGFSVERELEAGREPEHIVLSPDDATLFSANVGDGTVSVIDLVQGRVVDIYEVGPSPHGVDVSQDGRRLFVSSKQGETLTRIELGTGEVRSMRLGPAPYHLVYVHGPGRLYVSSRKLPKIWKVDPETLTVEGEIDIGGGVAHQMVIRPR